MQTEILMEKIKSLPREQLIEVEDFVDFLSNRYNITLGKDRHDAIADYATKSAGSEMDLDPDLECAAIEHLLLD